MDIGSKAARAWIWPLLSF